MRLSEANLEAHPTEQFRFLGCSSRHHAQATYLRESPCKRWRNLYRSYSIGNGSWHARLQISDI
ncbi:hypothetical protein I7I50_11863 [Histoplasma capsulatum G186AR]|uniref:Uncharacterized protein n=1 Tax=Ajellomyces capsulatus TaxID=5037 RepID=A0A8H8CS98_AJECA|nr:hypothetical protein I7I52_11822 [Histoplasma capsulatum]QSS70285.1 hypothetical protein I7I50_11863 [Histoplasma capsulatum G186AR]